MPRDYLDEAVSRGRKARLWGAESETRVEAWQFIYKDVVPVRARQSEVDLFAAEAVNLKPLMFQMKGHCDESVKWSELLAEALSEHLRIAPLHGMFFGKNKSGKRQGPKLSRTHVEVAEEFDRLVHTWRQDTMIESDPARIVTHQAYFRIIGLGLQALPHIFKDMQNGGGTWYVALEAITGENPIRPEHATSAGLMDADWLAWAKQQGYLDG